MITQEKDHGYYQEQALARYSKLHLNFFHCSANLNELSLKFYEGIEIIWFQNPFTN